MADPVNHPPHYTFGGIEVISAIEAWQLEFHEANAVKYIARAKHKEDRIQDLRKAIWYLQRKVDNLTKASPHQGESAESPLT